MAENNKIRLPILHLFIRAGMNRVLDMLIDGGMDVNATQESAEKITPLMTAVKSNNLHAVKDPTLVSRFGLMRCPKLKARFRFNKIAW